MQIEFRFREFSKYMGDDAFSRLKAKYQSINIQLAAEFASYCVHSDKLSGSEAKKLFCAGLA
jgi:hypothetical protein